MLERVRQLMEEREVDCLILTDKYNIAYALGEEFSGYIFITQEDVDLVVSRFYQYDLEQFSKKIAYSPDDYEKLLKEKAEKIDGRIVADEVSGRLEGVFELEETDLMQDARKVKTDEEVEKLEEASRITDGAFEKLRSELFGGITEWEGVSILNKHYAENATGSSFVTEEDYDLVQRNCLKPHRQPTGQKIREDDMVIVDTGARHSFYCADVTRTYCESPSERQIELFESVKKVQNELLEMMQPGTELGKIDERMKEMTEELGYDPKENILHLAGHSVGVKVHESPSISPGSEGEIKEGMVFAIEPALYVPEIGGCRIEDTVVIESGGARRLSKAERKL